MTLNNAPIYRRRRRVAVLAVVTIIAVPVALFGCDETLDRDACTMWPEVPPCTLNKG